MNLTPVRNLIACQLLPEAETTRGGIIIPGTARRKQFKLALVLDVGPGRLLETGQYVRPAVNVGDTVLLSEQAGALIELDGESTFLADADEVLAIVKPKESEQSRQVDL